jgi:hypothetical protein
VAESLGRGLLDLHRALSCSWLSRRVRSSTLPSLRLAALELIGEDDHPLLERDRHEPPALGPHGQQTRLLLEADEQEDIGEPEVHERPF